MSERGIEGNPTKIKAIKDMPEPGNIKEVQRLAGRVASVGKFLSRAGEKGLLSHHILNKPSNFEWTTKASIAFQQLKA